MAECSLLGSISVIAGGAEQPTGPKLVESAPAEKVRAKRLTIDTEPLFHKRLKARAAEEDTTIADGARQLLTDWAYRECHRNTTT